ncbi:hypothetical protein WI92_18420 [Burkholderia vietnamiensis]|nr:hypothetical protein WI92_18420 [Burkholderia vietnamiensis]
MQDSPLKLEHVGIAPEKHAEFKEAMLTAARAAVEAFPEQLETVKDTLRRVYPPYALAAFASYGMQVGLTDSGEQRKALPDILQHHAELLHAILLSLPFNEWGSGPLTPDAMQTLFDTVPTVSNTFYLQRILDGDSIQGDEQATVRSLQERIRMHTHGVRNWGYYEQVVALCRSLYAHLDAAMMAHHGFCATDLVDVLAALVSEFEKRQSAHWGVLVRVFKGKTARQIVQRYYQLVPELVGSADEMLASLPATVTRDQMMGMLMAHYDLRLLDTALFETPTVAELTGKSVETVSAVLKALSFVPGSLAETRPEFLFLDNPVWDRPTVAIGETYFCPLPQMAFSHIHRLVDRLAGEAGLQDALKERRAMYLEHQVEAVFRRAVPDADIRATVRWDKNGQQFENDLVVVIDRVVVIAEAKSHRLTPQGLRGAPDRVKRHIREMVLEPSIQSSRLEQLIQVARAGDAEATAILVGIGIDPKKADRVIRLSVTLDDLSILSASEQDFKEIGWVPPDHSLAPSILITDLECLADILDNGLLLLHYLSERVYLQKSLNLLGDELDFLGLYLASGFNLAALHGKFTEFSPSGMSSPIDRYYLGREAGLKIPKPKMNLSPLYRDIVERLVQVKPPGWTLIGFHLLSSADPAEQRAIERNLKKLRGLVQKNYRDPDHISTLIIRPPEARKATVMFYLFPEALRDRYRQTMAQVASAAIEADNVNTCVVFARCTEKWGQTFEGVLVVGRN